MENNKNIFLVDDDIDDQLFFTDALKEIDSGISCAIANNGREALEHLRKMTLLPEILFLDRRHDAEETIPADCEFE